MKIRLNYHLLAILTAAVLGTAAAMAALPIEAKVGESIENKTGETTGSTTVTAGSTAEATGSAAETAGSTAETAGSTTETTGSSAETTGSSAETAGSVAEEEALRAGLPTDLHAGFLIADAGAAIYSAFGHCAVRLWCPSRGLDYVFTFCMDATMENFIRYLRGTALAQYACIATDRFLQDYVDEGRTVDCYEINLTVEQIRALWQLYDEEAMRGPHFYFDFVRKNCSSMSLRAVERCLGGEKVVFGDLPQGVTGTYRQAVAAASHGRPWAYFVWGSVLGATGEEMGNIEDKACPPHLVETLQHATIQSVDGSSRPMLTGVVTNVVEGGRQYQRDGFPPIAAFLVLTAVALIITLLQYRGQGKLVVVLFDALLLTVQTLLGIFIFHQTCISHLDVMHGNWNLLLFNPLPFILWLCLRKPAWRKKLWMGCTVVTIVYIIFAAITPQIDIVHICMALPFTVRAAANSVTVKKRA